MEEWAQLSDIWDNFTVKNQEDQRVWKLKGSDLLQSNLWSPNSQLAKNFPTMPKSLESQNSKKKKSALIDFDSRQA